MTRIDFHVLPATGDIETDRWACKLTAKASRQGHRVYIQATSEAQARRLDELLWTFRDVSFLPHGLIGEGNEGVTILVGHGDTPPPENEVMINLAHPVPSFFSRFERVVEIVAADEEGRARARERYRFYQERGYSLTSHNINGDDD
ncbi:MAG: DNA polymerase III subunit chi [Chromatiales bacterium]